MLGEHCLMASSGSFSFQPWECWHFPDFLLILRIMQRAVVISRNYTSVLSCNASWMVPNFEWWICLHCKELLSSLRYSKEPALPLAKNSLELYLPRQIVCPGPAWPCCVSHVRRCKAGKWKPPSGGSPSSSSGAVGVSWAVPWLCCSETWPIPSFFSLLSMNISSLAIWLLLLISCLDPQGELLCVWFPKHTFHGSSCLPAQVQGSSLGPSTWQLSRFKHCWCQSWVGDSVLSDGSPLQKNPIIVSIPSDRTVTACTWTSWFSLFLSSCVTNNHQHSFTTYLCYFFPLSLYCDSLLAFFPKAFTSCLLLYRVHFLKSGSCHQAGMQIIRHMGSDSAIQFKPLYAASFSSACFGRN